MLNNVTTPAMINAIKDIATNDIPAITKDIDVITDKAGAVALADEYRKARIALNLNIVQVLTGCDIREASKADKGYKIKFRHRLPYTCEINEVVEIVDVFVRTVEEPFMKKLQAFMDQHDDADSIDIPGNQVIVPASRLITMDKINNKNLKNYILGQNGYDRLVDVAINAVDCTKIAAFGEAARTDADLKKSLIAAGVSIAALVAAATAFAVVKKKKEEAADATETTTTDVDLDDTTDVDLDTIEDTVDTDDAPVVELD